MVDEETLVIVATIHKYIDYIFVLIYFFSPAIKLEFM